MKLVNQYLGDDEMSVAHVNIENAQTKVVNVFDLNIIENNGKDLKIDISSLNNEQLTMLEDAINSEKIYTDIELFYIDESSVPYFGPDYIFSIENGILTAILKEKMRKYIK